jgi:hypothetical protein
VPGRKEFLVNLIECVMRAMTHLNIGATLGMAAWLVWSGLSVVAPADHDFPAPIGVVPGADDRAQPADPPPTPLLDARAHHVVTAVAKA